MKRLRLTVMSHPTAKFNKGRKEHYAPEISTIYSNYVKLKSITKHMLHALFSFYYIETNNFRNIKNSKVYSCIKAQFHFPLQHLHTEDKAINRFAKSFLPNLLRKLVGNLFCCNDCMLPLVRLKGFKIQTWENLYPLKFIL